MHPTAMQCLRSSVLGGASAFVAVPVAGTLPALVSLPPISDLGHIAMGAVIMAVIGAVVGPVVGFFVGFPALFALSRMGFAKPLVVAAVAAGIATVVVAGFFSWPPLSLSLVAFGLAVGVPCGLVAVATLNQSDRAARAAAGAGAQNEA
jgi:hypothetical protein